MCVVPDAPGIGPELAERHPYKPRAVLTRIYEDGAVMGQQGQPRKKPGGTCRCPLPGPVPSPGSFAGEDHSRLRAGRRHIAAR